MSTQEWQSSDRKTGNHYANGRIKKKWKCDQNSFCKLLVSPDLEYNEKVMWRESTQVKISTHESKEMERNILLPSRTNYVSKIQAEQKKL